MFFQTIIKSYTRQYISEVILESIVQGQVKIGKAFPPSFHPYFRKMGTVLKS